MAPIDWPAETMTREKGRAAKVLAAWLLAERDRWVLWAPVIVGLGIILYFELAVEPPWWPTAIALAACALMAVFMRHRPIPFVLCLIAGLFVLGFGAATLRTGLVDAPIVEREIGPTWVSGRIAEIGLDPKEARIVLEQVEIEGLAPSATPARIRLSLRGSQLEGAIRGAVPGESFRFRAVVRPPPGPTEPGAFDFGRQAYFDQIGAMGYVRGAIERLGERTDGGLAASLARVRHEVSRRMIDGLSGEAGPFAAALVIGERSAMPDELMVAMRNSGLAHLIAISGLNFAMVAGFVFVAVRFGLALVPALALRFPIKKWAAFTALLVSLGYLLLTGANVPTERAFLMTALVLIAVLIDRTSLSMRLLMWAALAIVLLSPEAVLSASFQMSFGATLALIAAYEAIRAPLGGWAARARWWHRPAVYFFAIAFTSLVAGIATGPFSLYHFNRFADFGLIANLIAVPLTGLWVMPWGLIALVLMPFGAEEAALVPMSLGLDGIAATARMVSAWPGSVSLVPSMPPAALGLIALGGCWLCLWRTRWRFLSVIAFGAAVLVIGQARPPDLLVDGEAKIFARRGEDGRLWLSSSRTARFVGESWLRRAGQEEAGPWPIDDGAASDDAEGSGGSERGPVLPPSCDLEGCVYSKGATRVAVLRGLGALDEECPTADLVVALFPIRKRDACTGPSVLVDRFDLWRRGTHAFWIDGGAITVRTVAQDRGDRPWSRSRRLGRDAQ